MAFRVRMPDGLVLEADTAYEFHQLMQLVAPEKGRKGLSLWPLTFEEAVHGLLQVKPKGKKP